MKTIHVHGLELGRLDAEQLLDLLPALANRGVEPTLAVLISPDRTRMAGELFSELRCREIECHALEYSWDLDPRLTTGLHRILEKVSPDIVHVEGATGELHGTPAARLKNLPVVASRNGSSTASLSRLAGRGLTAVTPLITRIITASPGLSDEMAHSGQASREQLASVAPGVAPSSTGRERRGSLRNRWNLRPDDQVILSAGEFRRDQDHSVLLEAAARLRERAATPNRTRLILAGDGPERDSLREQIDGLALRGEAWILQDDSCYRDMVSAADVVAVVPSDHPPVRAVLLAMQAAMPVVTTQLEPLSDLVADGVTGVHVPARNPAMIAAAFSRVLEDPMLGAEMGRMGRHRQESYFSFERHLDQLTESYSRCIAACRSAAGT